MTREDKCQYWQVMIDKFSGSDVSVRVFCRESELNYAQFLYWQKRLKTVPQEKLGSEEILFEELALTQQILLSSGDLKIQVDKNIDLSSLSLVIGALCDAAGR